MLTAARPLSSLHGIDSAVVYGGADKDDQVEYIKTHRPQIIIATPGRLLDIIGMEHPTILSIRKVRYVVLDEADKLFNLGFEEQINSILKELPEERQTLLFSATFPEAVQGACDRWLKNATHLKLEEAEGESGSRISPAIEQVIHVLKEHKKPKKLMKFIDQVAESDKGKRSHSRILIFVKNNKTAEYLKDLISLKNKAVKGTGGDKGTGEESSDPLASKTNDVAGEKNGPGASKTKEHHSGSGREKGMERERDNVSYRVATLHGHLSQPQREKTFADFKAAKVPILIATDLASRGLHVSWYH